MASSSSAALVWKAKGAAPANVPDDLKTVYDANPQSFEGELVRGVPAGLMTCPADFDPSRLTKLMTDVMVDGCETAQLEAIAVNDLRDLNKHFADDKATHADFQFQDFGDEEASDVGTNAAIDLDLLVPRVEVIVVQEEAALSEFTGQAAWGGYDEEPVNDPLETIGVTVVTETRESWEVAMNELEDLLNTESSELEGLVRNDRVEPTAQPAALVPLAPPAAQPETVSPPVTPTERPELRSERLIIESGTPEAVDHASGVRPETVSICDNDDDTISATAEQAALEVAIAAASQASSPKGDPARVFEVPEGVPAANRLTSAESLWRHTELECGTAEKRKTPIGLIPLRGLAPSLSSRLAWKAKLTDAKAHADTMCFQYDDKTRLRVPYSSLMVIAVDGSEELLMTRFPLMVDSHEFPCLLDVAGSLWFLSAPDGERVSRAVTALDRSFPKRDYHTKCSVCTKLACPAFADSDGWQACHYECKAGLRLFRQFGHVDPGVEAISAGDDEMHATGDVVDAYVEASSCVGTTEHARGFLVDLRRHGALGLDSVVDLAARVKTAVLVHLGPEIASQSDWVGLSKDAVLGGPSCRALIRRTIGCRAEHATIQIWDDNVELSADQLRSALMRSTKRDGASRRSTVNKRRSAHEESVEEADGNSSDSLSHPVSQNSSEQIRELTNAVTELGKQMAAMRDTQTQMAAENRRRFAFMNQELSKSFTEMWGPALDTPEKANNIRMLFAQRACEEDMRVQRLTGLGLYGREGVWRTNDDRMIENEVKRQWEGLSMAWQSTAEVARPYLTTEMPEVPRLSPARVMIGDRQYTYSAEQMGPLVTEDDMIAFAAQCERSLYTPTQTLPSAPEMVPVVQVTDEQAKASYATSSSSPAAPQTSVSAGGNLGARVKLIQGSSVELPMHTLSIFRKANRYSQVMEFRKSAFAPSLQVDNYMFELQGWDADLALEAMDVLLYRLAEK